MAVVAYSPIARGDARGNAVLARIGSAHKKTAVQVCLRFLVQHDIVVIPRTSKVERLSENAAIFDFELSKQEMTEIAGARASGRQGGGLGVFRPAEVGLSIIPGRREAASPESIFDELSASSARTVLMRFARFLSFARPRE